MPHPDVSRTARHQRVPIMLAQVTALRTVALEASQRASSPDQAIQIGEILTSNMNAGFALELVLKSFFMSFHEEPPARVHGLHGLYKQLPEPWRHQIDGAYRTDPRRQSDVVSVAYQAAPTAPETPEPLSGLAEFKTAESCFAAVSTIFHDSRYFFEEIGAGGWATIRHPIGQMVAMIDVLAAFRQHLLTEAANHENGG